ncbi:alpha/beta fold hydrolase [Streptomyces gelaticus]
MSCPAGRTVVLVHGAFTDASSYAAVIPLLLREGLDVVAPAVPNRGLGGDSAYVASVVRAIPGPVVLVGHGYGGAVITVAGVEDNVMALVYLAGYALDEGECLGELQGKFPAPPWPVPSCALRFPVGGRAGRRRRCRWTSRASPRCSRPASIRSRRGSWLCPSARWPIGRSPRTPLSPPGRPNRPGAWSPRRTAPSTPIWSATATCGRE